MAFAKGLSDAEVEREIERLRADEHVKLAKLEERVRYKRRQVLYNLRQYEKKGKELAAAGITDEILRGMDEEES